MAATENKRPRGQKSSVYHCECGDHAWCALTKGHVTLVSPVDAPLLVSALWSTGGSSSAQAVINGKVCLLHRLLCPELPEGWVVDHKNGDRLDNRRNNLRPCTHWQNILNQKKPKNNSSGYKGVWYDKQYGVYRAEIKIRRRKISLGRYKDPKAASDAYEAAAKVYFGEFARV